MAAPRGCPAGRPGSEHVKECAKMRERCGRSLLFRTVNFAPRPQFLPHRGRGATGRWAHWHPARHLVHRPAAGNDRDTRAPFQHQTRAPDLQLGPHKRQLLATQVAERPAAAEPPRLCSPGTPSAARAPARDGGAGRHYQRLARVLDSAWVGTDVLRRSPPRPRAAIRAG